MPSNSCLPYVLITVDPLPPLFMIPPCPKSRKSQCAEKFNQSAVVSVFQLTPQRGPISDSTAAAPSIIITATHSFLTGVVIFPFPWRELAQTISIQLLLPPPLPTQTLRHLSLKVRPQLCPPSTAHWDAGNFRSQS